MSKSLKTVRVQSPPKMPKDPVGGCYQPAKHGVNSKVNHEQFAPTKLDPIPQHKQLCGVC